MTVYLSDTNPNETPGGGGCLVCGPTKNPDQRGPFAIVVNANEMESNLSPIPVVCATCFDELRSAFASEALSAGERGYSVEVVPVPTEDDEEEVPSL